MYEAAKFFVVDILEKMVPFLGSLPLPLPPSPISKRLQSATMSWIDSIFTDVLNVVSAPMNDDFFFYKH
jgi:hypothetical protein